MQRAGGFFGHPATKLSLAEASIIAGLVKAPSRYAPSADPEAARRRAATVIAAMVKAGDVTPAEAAAADPTLVRFASPGRQTGARYFTDWVLTQLAGHMKSNKHRKAEELIAKGRPIRIIAESDFMAFRE